MIFAEGGKSATEMQRLSSETWFLIELMSKKEFIIYLKAMAPYLAVL